MRLTTLAEVIGRLGPGGRTGIVDGTEIRARRQNAVKAVIVTDDRVPRSPVGPAAARPSPMPVRGSTTGPWVWGLWAWICCVRNWRACGRSFA
ncbi:hypothetical protein [Streptomyces chumphonensis]|uniref:hypothetical protein n=1 Tax=Streptomyces chumphonensis TaxID=1214925 RepID=UPI003D755890